MRADAACRRAIDSRDLLVIRGKTEVHPAEVTGGVYVNTLAHVAVLEHGAFGERVKYCMRCREAECDWNETHPEDSFGPVETTALQIENPGSDIDRVVELLQESFYLSTEQAEGIAQCGEEILDFAVDPQGKSLRSLLEDAGATVCEIRVGAGA